MDLRFTTSAAQDANVDLLAVLVDDPAQLPPAIAPLDAKFDGSITRELGRGLVKADAASCITVTGAADGPGRVALVGFGPKAEHRLDAIRTAGGKIAGAARAGQARSVAIVSPSDTDELAALIE